MFSFLKTSLAFIKKAFLVFAVFFIIISLFLHFINKDKISFTSSSPASSIKKNRAEIYKIINDKNLTKTKEGKIAISLYKVSMCSLIGEACTDNPNDADKNFKKSTFGFISNLLVVPFVNPPASGIAWVSDSLRQAGFAPKAYAAEGLGFSAIKPFSNLWKIFRDISYMLLVIILIAIGFMIMFRAKINPQTIISVENSLPKIVIALILITFSFAIAGFIIDLMYISIILIISVLSNGNTFFSAAEYQNKFVTGNFGDLTKSIAVGDLLLTAPKIGDALVGIIDPTIVFTIRAIAGLISVIISFNLFYSSGIKPIAESLNGIGLATAQLGGIIGALTTTPISFLVLFIVFLLGSTYIFSLLIWLLVGGTILYIAFKIFAILFMSYIKTLLLVIISPILLIFEAIPGKNIFSWWLKNLIGNLIAFPITIAILLIGYIIVNSTVASGYSEMRLPFLYGVDSSSFKILVGMGLIFLIPDIIKMVKETLGIKELPLNIGLGTFFGGAAAVGGGGIGMLGQVGSLSLGLSAVTGKNIHDMFGAKKPLTKGGNPPPVVDQAATIATIKQALGIQ